MKHLLGVDFPNALVGVLVIIGIIVVAAFVIFFLGDLLLSVLDPNYVRFGKRTKGKKKEEKEEPSYYNPEQNQPQNYLTYNGNEDYQHQENIKAVDYDAAKREEELLNKGPILLENQTVNIRAEEERYRAEQLAKLQEEKRLAKEKAAEEQRKKDEEWRSQNMSEIFFGDEDTNIFDVEEKVAIAEVKTEIKEDSEKLAMAETIRQLQEKLAEEEENKRREDQETLRLITEKQAYLAAEEKAVAEEESQRLMSEVEMLRQQLAAEKELAKLLAEEKAELARAKKKKADDDDDDDEGRVIKPNMHIITGILTKEEYEDRIGILKDRLAINEKQLRKVKKEFIPLRKVKKTLGRDEEKLRRKEAIVAKKRIVLFGVNNMIDINSEKAKELEEDLDLLEGLRLSVQHCQDVMRDNQQRYPVLEKTHEILLNENTDIKADLAAYERALELMRTNEVIIKDKK